MRLASRGLRNLDGGNERLTDFTVRLALRRRGRQLSAAGAAIAAAVTLVVFAL